MALKYKPGYTVCITYWKILMIAKVFTKQESIRNGCKRSVVSFDVNTKLVLR